MYELKGKNNIALLDYYVAKLKVLCEFFFLQNLANYIFFSDLSF